VFPKLEFDDPDLARFAIGNVGADPLYNRLTVL
jgi:hypothetical protein